MRFLAARIKNFGSYKHLEFTFENQGLALIYGATGSGKSTLQDVIPWCLFGETSKDGTVDEIKSWLSNNDITEVLLFLETSQKEYVRVTRRRGNTHENDLFWVEANGNIHRGKDITETQKLLEKRLNLTPYLYKIGAYYNEFSPTSTFFTTKASDRRELFENLANLSLPTTLSERLSDVKKSIKKDLIQAITKLEQTTGRLDQLRRFKGTLQRDVETWSQTQERTLEELEAKKDRFLEEKKTKFEILQLKADRYEETRTVNLAKYEKQLDLKIAKFSKEKACEKCGHVKTKDGDELLQIHDEYVALIDSEKQKDNPYLSEQKQLNTQENPYVEWIKKEKSKANPHVKNLEDTVKNINTAASELTCLEDIVNKLNYKQSSVVHLQKLTDQLRGELISQTVSNIQQDVNYYLSKHFHSELKVEFKPEAADKIEVSISKSGHQCSYRQLSKGQRSLLKLVFAVAVMKAAELKTGTVFNTLMFDEPADGVDGDLKLKAYGLFDELALNHESIFVIDHAESLQSLFCKKFHVTIKNDLSSIEEL